MKWRLERVGSLTLPMQTIEERCCSFFNDTALSFCLSSSNLQLQIGLLSKSVVLQWECVACFLDHQQMMFGPRKIQALEVYLLSSLVSSLICVTKPSKAGSLFGLGKVHSMINYAKLDTLDSLYMLLKDLP